MQKRWMIPVSVMMVLAGSMVSPAAAEDEVPSPGVETTETTAERPSEDQSERRADSASTTQTPPKFRVVDSTTGQARAGAKFNVSFRELPGGEITDEGGFYISDSGKTLETEVWFGQGWDEEKGEATKQLILTEDLPAPGCTATETPIVLEPTSATDWRIVSGPEGVYVSEGNIVEYRSSCSPVPSVPGDGGELSYDGFSLPRFVVVDDVTGQPLAGSFWGGESCGSPSGATDVSCESLDNYRMEYPLNPDESPLIREIEHTAAPYRHMKLENRLPAPGCVLRPESVEWEVTGTDGKVVTHIEGDGVYEYDRTPDHRVWAIPMSCPNTGNKAQFGAAEPGSRYEEDEAFLGGIPAIYKTSWDTGAVLPGSIWEVDYCSRENSGEDFDCEEGYEIEFETDGSGITRDILLRGDSAVDPTTGEPIKKFSVREIVAPVGYGLNPATYEFTPDKDGVWGVRAVDSSGAPFPYGDQFVYELGPGDRRNSIAIADARAGVSVKKFVESLPEGDGQKGSDPVHVAGDAVEVRYRVSVPDLSGESLTMLELVDSNIDFTVDDTVVQTADKDTAVIDEPLTCTVDKAASGQASYLDGAEFTVDGSRFTEDGVNKAKFEFPAELTVAPGQVVNCVSMIERLGNYHADMAALTSHGKFTNVLMEARDPLFVIRQGSTDGALLSGGALLGAALGSSLLGSSGSSAPGSSGPAADSPVSPEAAPAPAAPLTDQAPEGGEKSGLLAQTGADVAGFLAAGLLALVIGALLVFMRRRRS
ncbi:LPXTG cell wall anchor domain-containing protein [Corynebacterium sp. CCM 8835]|uniref:LPXTG cell wall anchor domain-containing protein n=1 Tax=Corynebacterium antarcticum TaxID=2800405 RepID=A0ABS1FM22_9CORY|nr:LPXTG cell wall anchor domain-containing protein [Corynebacterium antarcticum]MCL0246334.1 LPXTG cell wall anchor domain-containing protein [Corynebacterium antarcticum]